MIEVEVTVTIGVSQMSIVHQGDDIEADHIPDPNQSHRRTP